MHTHRYVDGRWSGWGEVSPVDGEQCAVRARGAQLPGTVGHVPVAVSQEDQRGEGGELAGEGPLLCRGGEGRGTALHLHTHSHLIHPLSMVRAHVSLTLHLSLYSIVGHIGDRNTL